MKIIDLFIHSPSRALSFIITPTTKYCDICSHNKLKWCKKICKNKDKIYKEKECEE